MGADQPFLYNAPSRISFGEREFNPKAATQTSRQPIKARPTREGPLVEFNKHPDSYLILPSGDVNAKPMKPRTRKTVKQLRQLQLLVRCLQLLGTLGLLVCVLCLRGVEESLGWTLRVPVGFDDPIRRNNRCCANWSLLARGGNHALRVCDLSSVPKPDGSHANIDSQLYALCDDDGFRLLALLRLHRADQQYSSGQASRYGMEIGFRQSYCG